MAVNTTTPTPSGLQVGMQIPQSILQQDILSTTSEAYACFVNQGFSANLQAFLINYVISISGPYSVYA